ncbi:MAG TPA: GNAT family N-acetyltransferase [Polyangiaceae bacterium]|nr:GNAT family N-acetyltransferase [Polyangiaceae bacterium]
MIELRTHRSIRDFAPAGWDALLGPNHLPFMSWAFLDALEVTGCVRPEVGWLPQHLGMYRRGELVAVAPAYVKGNSEGEFVFDHSWARFCEEHLGTEYYPKLVVASPFTPATGPRLLHAPTFPEVEAHAALAEGLARLTDGGRLSSSHVLFLPEAAAAQLARAGLLQRHGLQFHWRNAGYATFDDFLSRFSSKRRHAIRRERREVAESGIELVTRSGDELGAGDIDHMYEFYISTVDKHFYGKRYLNREFFHEICARIPKRILVVFARERGSHAPIAGAFNLLGDRALFGRYWGARQERPFLHFNVCYYAGIEACIERKLECFEPGAGGEHKHVRGFESTLTYSAHFIRDPRLRGPVERFLRQESAAIMDHLGSEKPVLKTALDEVAPLDPS